MRVSSITKNAGKACNNRLYRHIRTFEKIIKNYFVISVENMISYDTYAFFKNYSTEFTTPDFIGFSVFFQKSSLMYLVSHLFCNFFCKVFFFLFDTFSSFETNESFHSNFSAVFFSNLFYVFSYRLFSIFCFYVYLI